MTTPPQCCETDKEYRIGANVNVNVSPFFQTTCAAEWSFQNYAAWRRSQSAKIKFNKLMRDFQTDLDVIKGNEDIPTTVRSHAGNMLRFIKQSDKGDIKSKTTTPQIIYNNNIVGSIVGSVLEISEVARNLGDEQQQPQQQQESSTARQRRNSKQNIMMTSDDEQYTEDEVWDMWTEFLDQAKADGSIHKYSPAKHNVIICGKGISPKPGMDRDHYYSFLNGLKEFVDLTVDSDSLEAMEDALYSALVAKGSGPVFRFLRSMFHIMLTLYQISPPLSHSESVLNANLIWPSSNACMKFVRDHYSNNHDTNTIVYFVPGEEQLNAMTKQLKRIGARHDDRYRYNADGVVRVNSLFDLEIMILETSNHFGSHDLTKHSFDFHKALFGVLAMFKSITDQFEYASIKSLMKLRIYFVHVSGDVGRIWSLRYNTSNAYVFCREDKVKLHQRFEEKEDHILPLCHFFDNLKGKIIRCVDQLAILQREHKENKRLSRYHQSDNFSLLSDIITPSILRLTQHQDSRGLADEVPGSSPSYFDYI